MSAGLRYALPLGQMALAAWILRLSFLYELAMARSPDLHGLHPAFEVLLWLNLPVAVPLRFLASYRYLPSPWFDAVFILAIGVLWYWIASRMILYRERKPLLRFASKPLRITADLLLIAMGAFLGWLLMGGDGSGFPPRTLTPYYFGLPYSSVGWLFAIPTWASSLFWFLGPVMVFGYDLIQCIRGRRVQS